MPKFSVITPVHLATLERSEQFLRCIKSVKAQTFKDFEWIVIDDGSTVPFLWDNLLNGFSLNLIHKNNEERVIAYNTAFQVAKGDWFVFLDSDDELPPEALETWNKYIHSNNGIRMFNCGAKYIYKDGGGHLREPFRLKWMGSKYGHEVFGGGSGHIVNGTFIFNRSIYDKLGGFPPPIMEEADCTEINYPMGGSQYIRPLHMNTPYDFSAAAQLEFPAIRQYFMVDHENEPSGKIIKELGNPWGQDYYLFYKYTRKYKSMPIDEYLYWVHPK